MTISKSLFDLKPYIMRMDARLNLKVSVGPKISD